MRGTISCPSCFNPRVRAGRDQRSTSPSGCCHVSIHASARDATVSILQFSSLKVFQSTRPRGTRRTRGQILHAEIGVSIHASARDATPPGPILSARCLFQSTRPRGTRRKTLCVPRGSVRFNPRVRAGRDLTIDADTSSRALFQSTRPRGTRPAHGVSILPRAINVSIHASARDATFIRIIICCSLFVSIHASARDATSMSWR